MANITAAAVKSLRERTGLPMMECKKALVEADGNEEAAIETLAKKGKAKMAGRAGRETACGRVAIHSADGVSAMVELLCESAPVATHDEFIQLIEDLAQQLATGPGADSADALLDQPCPSAEGKTLREQYDDLNNRIREVFKLNRLVRIDNTCGGYVHHNGGVGVLLEVEGENADLAKDICMHVAAMRPLVVSVAELDADVVAKEREVLSAAARDEGKPEGIIEKMVEGRMKNFYAESVLTEQPFVKDDKKSVGQCATDGGLKIVRMVHWALGKE